MDDEDPLCVLIFIHLALTSIISAVGPGMNTTLAAQTDFTQDDMAFAYSLAGIFPDHYFSTESYP